MTKQELEYQLQRANYDLELQKLQEEVITMAKRCKSVQTLQDMKDSIEDVFREYIDTWENVGCMGNICNIAQQLSDNYKADKLKYLNMILFDIALEDKDVNTENLYMTAEMNKVKLIHEEREGVA